MSDTAHYRLLATALPAEEKRIRSSYLPSLVLVVALTSVVFVVLGIRQGATSKSMIRYGLIVGAYIAFLSIWYPRRVKRRLNRCWETYELEIGRDYLLRRQADIPDLRLQFDEVQAVERVRGRYLRVVGNPGRRTIAIPEGIDQFDQVLEIVSSIRPVRERTIEQWHKYRAFMAAALLLFVIMLWATSPAVVIPLSLAMGSVVVWAFFWIRRNPNIPESSRRIAWIYWPIFFVCVLKVLAALSPHLPQNEGYAIAVTLLFSPFVLLIVGSVRWLRPRYTQHWRTYFIGIGLAATSISALCLYGVLLFIRLAHIGNLNEHRLTMAGVYVGWPLSAFSVPAALVGEGRSRVMLGLAAFALAIVWTIAFLKA